MSEEMLDWVNDADEIIGEVSKTEAHKGLKYLHRHVVVIIYDSQNRVLFHLRSKSKSIDPGHWIIGCAGHVPKGMDPEDAAHKELLEEAGFDTELKFLDKERYDLETERRFFYIYKGNYKNEKIEIDKTEADDIKFLSKKDYTKLLNENVLFGEHTKELLKKHWKN